MIKVDYPVYAHKIKKEGEVPFLFDPIRRRWVRLTPEEWVRQNFIQYLLQVMGYPASLLSVEKEIQVGELKKRYDIVVFRDDVPWLMVECKQADVELVPAVLEQALRYHISVPVDYVVITNGHYTFAWVKEGGKLRELGEIPLFR